MNETTPETPAHDGCPSSLPPEKIVLSRESAELVDDALALVSFHGPVYALKWLAARMEQKAAAGPTLSTAAQQA